MDELFPTIVYSLCFVTSSACAYLLGRSYSKTGARLLLWSALCFFFPRDQQPSSGRRSRIPAGRFRPSLRAVDCGAHRDLRAAFRLRLGPGGGLR